jgi:hypothetical protein
MVAAGIRPLRWAGSDDLESQAYLILCQQTPRFWPDSGVPFRAFMTMQLRGRLWTYVRNKIDADAATVSDSETVEREDRREAVDPNARGLLQRLDRLGDLARLIADGCNPAAAARALGLTHVELGEMLEEMRSLV